MLLVDFGENARCRTVQIVEARCVTTHRSSNTCARAVDSP